MVVSHHAPDATFGHIFLDPVPGNEVRAGHLIAVTPDGQVVSVSASLEVNDTASGGDCVFGVTAIGP